MKKVVLFDFHNTLATCDGWLELEIKTLPSKALERLAARGLVEGHTAEMGTRATLLFQGLRKGVRESGVELSALEGTRRVLSQMGLHLAEAELEGVVVELEHEVLPYVEALPGAMHALAQLRDRGYRLGVVSSAGFPPFVEMALEMLGLRAYFNEVITSAGEGLYKSNPEIFRRAVSRLGALPEEAVHVGDHPIYDVYAAKAAGLAAVWLTAMSGSTAHLHSTSWDEAVRYGAGADAVVESMDELPGAIEMLK